VQHNFQGQVKEEDRQGFTPDAISDSIAARIHEQAVESAQGKELESDKDLKVHKDPELKAEWEQVQAQHLLEDKKVGSKGVEEELASRFVGDANENALYSMSAWDQRKKQQLQGDQTNVEKVDPFLARSDPDYVQQVQPGQT